MAVAPTDSGGGCKEQTHDHPGIGCCCPAPSSTLPPPHFIPVAASQLSHCKRNLKLIAIFQLSDIHGIDDLQAIAHTHQGAHGACSALIGSRTEFVADEC